MVCIMGLKLAVWIAVATAIHRARLTTLPEDLTVLKELSNGEIQSLNITTEEEEDLRNRASFDLSYQTQSTEDGPVIIPWINQVGVHGNARPSLPVCYNQPPNQNDVMIRLAHVICRQSGFVTATKWFGIRKEILGLHLNASGLSAYCRGDEQFVDHCRWHYPTVSPCSHFLAIECGDCSRSYLMAEETRINLASPGFPIYIPLMVCEWNVTLLPENSLLIRFQQFELPSPVYDESINAISCRSGSLDIMSWHEDIKKMALDGRFCGRYSPGNLTIYSNRILIRFTAGSFKIDDATKKGFLAECSVVPSAQLSSHFAMVRWVLTGSAIFITITIALFFWIWKGNLHNLYSRFCLSCCANSVATGEVHPGLATLPLPTVVPPSCVTTFSGVACLEDQRRETMHGRRGSETKVLDRECDIRHWDHTRRLEKWHSTNRAARSSSAGFVSMQGIELKNEISFVSTTKDKNESHVYEEIDINLQNGCSGASCIHPISSSASPRMIMPFISRSLFERPPMILYQHTSTYGPLATNVLLSRPQVSPHHQQARQSPLDRSGSNRPPCFHCRSSESVFSTSSHLALSSESGDSTSLSGIYINPEPDFEE